MGATRPPQHAAPPTQALSVCKITKQGFTPQRSLPRKTMAKTVVRRALTLRIAIAHSLPPLRPRPAAALRECYTSRTHSRLCVPAAAQASHKKTKAPFTGKTHKLNKYQVCLAARLAAHDACVSSRIAIAHSLLPSFPQVFSAAKRPEIKEKNPEIDHKSVQKKISEMWAELSQDEKDAYKL
jgi:hypothetical protein